MRPFFNLSAFDMSKLRAFKISLFAVISFLPLLAQAQWQFSAGAGLRHVRMTEHDRNGRTLVQEEGWMPGVELRADYALEHWRLGLSAQAYRRDIGYDGRLQGGAPFATDTGTTQARIGVMLARRVGESTHLLGGLEWDRWVRDIRGRNGVLGLNERYSSWRLLAGAETSLLQAASVDIGGKALLVFAAPERMNVRFDNRIYEDVSLSTKSAFGLRAALDFHLKAAPAMTVSAGLDWIRIPRSDDAVLRQAGMAVSTVAQPEHVRRAFDIKLTYRF